MTTYAVSRFARTSAPPPRHRRTREHQPAEPAQQPQEAQESFSSGGWWFATLAAFILAAAALAAGVVMLMDAGVRIDSNIIALVLLVLGGALFALMIGAVNQLPAVQPDRRR